MAACSGWQQEKDWVQKWQLDSVASKPNDHADKRRGF
jgi:hypothetical protein